MPAVLDSHPNGAGPRDSERRFLVVHPLAKMQRHTPNAPGDQKMSADHTLAQRLINIRLGVRLWILAGSVGVGVAVVGALLTLRALEFSLNRGEG